MDLNEFHQSSQRINSQNPANQDLSKMLVAENLITSFNKLHDFLDSNDVLVINNTKVILQQLY